MSAATTRLELLDKLAKRGYVVPFRSAPTVGTTAPNQASGFLSATLAFNFVGTTIASTLVGLPAAVSPSEAHTLALLMGAGNSQKGSTLCWLYQIGTLNLAATGDQFTHDAATFPVLRKRMGTASQPVALHPLVFITTATTVTAPIFTIKNAGASTGYVDEDGNTVVGTKTVTLPNAATTLGSAYLPRLEEGDRAVRDIQSINVGTAGSAGAATIFGVEPICALPFVSTAGPLAAAVDTFSGTLQALDLRPAVATSGTVVAYLSIVTWTLAPTSQPFSGLYMAGGNA